MLGRGVPVRRFQTWTWFCARALSRLSPLPHRLLTASAQRGLDATLFSNSKTYSQWICQIIITLVLRLSIVACLFAFALFHVTLPASLSSVRGACRWRRRTSTSLVRMLFIIVNAVLSAALFIVVVVPLPHIYDPEGGPVGSSGSPIAGEVVLDEGVTPSVRQKLYLLFVIPVCTSVQALFLYFAYYRPLRLIHYRVELNLLALRLTSEARRHQLQKSGVLVLSNRHIVGGGACASSFPVSSAAVVSAHRSGMSAGRGHFDQGSSAAQRLASTVKWGWCRHVRPKSVRKDAWANSAVFAEIGRLRDELELRFLIEGNVTEENLTRAVLKTVDVCTPSTCADVPGQVDDTVAEAAKQNDFYLSSHPPLAALRPTRADLRDAPQNGTTSNGKAAPSPRRDSSALLVPTESYHRNHLRQSAIPASLGGSKLYALRSGLDTSQHVGVHAVADLSPSAGGYSLARHHEPVEMSTSPVEQEGVRTIVHAGTGGIR